MYMHSLSLIPYITLFKTTNTQFNTVFNNIMATNMISLSSMSSKNQIRVHFLPVYSHINETNELCLLLTNTSGMCHSLPK